MAPLFRRPSRAAADVTGMRGQDLMFAGCPGWLTVVQWRGERGPGDRGAAHPHVGDGACVCDVCGALAALKRQPFAGCACWDP